MQIWDLEITVAGKELAFNPDISSNCAQYVSYSSGKYIDTINSQKAYLLDFNDAGRKCISKDTQHVLGASITISFDYYLTGAEDEEIVLSNVAGGAELADKDIGTAKLFKGRNHLTHTSDNYSKESFLLDFRTTDTDRNGERDETSNAKIYIWNVEVMVNGADVFSTGGNATYDEGNATITKMTVGDVPFRGDSNNDGKVNVLDLIRLKRYLLDEIYVKESQANAYFDHRIDALDIVATKKAILGAKIQ